MRNLSFAKLLVLVLGFVAFGSVFAQVTSGDLVGRVTDPSGNPVVGAEVLIVHVPSGTRRTVTSTDGGLYSSRGLRVGGPYTVTVTASGFQGTSVEDIAVPLGNAVTVNLALDAIASSDQAIALDTVQVVGTEIAGGTFDPANMGTTTQITRDQIENNPSVDSTIQDYVRLDPRIVVTDRERGEFSAAGQNPRYNGITIDGIKTNDDFGLNANGLPGENQPTAFEWLEEFNIGISPYDVTQNDFVGAQINAVTKSGTNEFSGGGYARYRDADMISDRNGSFTGFDDQLTWGAYIGGPIIQDKLFFFVGFEDFERSGIAPDIRIVDDPQQGAPNNTYIGDLSDAQRVLDIASATYGLNNLGELGASPDGTNADQKVIAKIDWNITDLHRLSARYNTVDGPRLFTPGLSRFDYSVESYWYNQVKEFENYVAQLYSDWTPNFSTELQLGLGKYRSVPENNSFLPQFEVRLPNTALGNGPDLLFGTERFRQANALETDTFTASLVGTYFLGAHTIKAGFDYTQTDIFNLFLESVNGRYTFSSIDNFERGVSSFYEQRVSSTGNLNDAAADWTYENWGLFIQDTWQVNYNLNLMFGLRLDTPVIDDKPTFNQGFFDRFGLRNDTTIDGNDLFGPRVGFNYTFNTERQTQLRGGLGLFNGSAPGVWLSNPFTNNGLSIEVRQASRGITTVSTDPLNQPDVPAIELRQDVDVVTDDVEQPAIWKANLAFDHELPFYGIIGQIEFGLAEVESAIHYTHENLGAPTGTLPDGRPRFQADASPTRYPNGNASGVVTRANRAAGFNEVVVLRNTNKGQSRDVSIAFGRPLEENWSWKFAYVHTDTEEVNPGTSSRAISNWNSRMITDPNEEIASTSNYEIANRAFLNVGYRRQFIGDLTTSVNMFWEWRNGRPYSYGFANDANGDGATNDLIYVPTGVNDPLVTYSDPRAAAAFDAYINANPELASFRGRIFERNAARAPSFHQIDLKVSQEIPGIAGWGRGKLFFNVYNFGNLLNDDWGVIEEVGFPGNARIANFGGVNAQGQYVYVLPGCTGQGGSTSTCAYNPTIFTTRDNAAESRWALQVGVSYDF